MISIRSDLDRLVQELTYTQREQVPFATALALTALAWSGRRATQAEMERKLQKPGRFALRQIKIDKATKRAPVARVKVDNTRIFGHLFTGGTREQKPYERYLISNGYMDAGSYTVPGPGAKLNAAGNISRSNLSKIIAKLTPPVKSTLAPGIWRAFRPKDRIIVVKEQVPVSEDRRPRRRKERPPELILGFVKDPTYKQFVDLEKVVESEVRNKASEELEKALDFALRTAR